MGPWAGWAHAHLGGGGGVEKGFKIDIINLGVKLGGGVGGGGVLNYCMEAQLFG